MNSEKAQYITDTYTYLPSGQQELEYNQYLLQIPEGHILKITIPEKFLKGPWISYQLSDFLKNNDLDNFTQTKNFIRALSEKESKELDDLIEGKITEHDLKEVKNYSFDKVEVQKGVAFLNSVVTEFRKSIPSALHKEQALFIFYAFLSWIIPAAFLYSIGWSIAWIYQGFRNKKSA